MLPINCIPFGIQEEILKQYINVNFDNYGCDVTDTCTTKELFFKKFVSYIESDHVEYYMHYIIIGEFTKLAPPINQAFLKCLKCDKSFTAIAPGGNSDC